jgi:hypothetical protein
VRVLHGNGCQQTLRTMSAWLQRIKLLVKPLDRQRLPPPHVSIESQSQLRTKMNLAMRERQGCRFKT